MKALCALLAFSTLSSMAFAGTAVKVETATELVVLARALNAAEPTRTGGLSLCVLLQNFDSNELQVECEFRDMKSKQALIAIFDKVRLANNQAIVSAKLKSLTPR